MNDGMDNGTMEVATSLGVVGAGAAAGTLAGSIGGPVGGVIGAMLGAVVGGIAGRQVGRMIARPSRVRNPGLMEVLDITKPADAKADVK